MIIHELTYYNHELEWRFESIKFSDFNLLVGVSGVGKTQILKSIMNLQKITKGTSLNGIEWDVKFTSAGYHYRWLGEFETKTIDKFAFLINDELEDKNNFLIIREELYLNNNIIIERNKEEIIFNDNKLPKLSPFKSVVEILGEEEYIAPVKNGFNKVIPSSELGLVANSIDSQIRMHLFGYKNLHEQYSSLEKIKESNLHIQAKLALIYNHYQKLFQKIKNDFTNIFEQVEDIKIEPYDDIDELTKFLADYPIIKIKEKGVTNWINQEHISSGMLKTLIHISELYLSAEGTVILIDEFENSLGINCIDILGDLLSENRELQFIITSHHPYIINNVSMEHWKIITRKGGVVTARDAQDFNLGQSRHQAFMQLINLDEYREGITA
ncbi:ATP-binding protein [Nostoc sp. CMAA1605]|nr:ATP-binding protein [Nostoc sp. CMAA1605]